MIAEHDFVEILSWVQQEYEISTLVYGPRGIPCGLWGASRDPRGIQGSSRWYQGRFRGILGSFRRHQEISESFQEGSKGILGIRGDLRRVQGGLRVVSEGFRGFHVYRSEHL